MNLIKNEVNMSTDKSMSDRKCHVRFFCVYVALIIIVQMYIFKVHASIYNC